MALLCCLPVVLAFIFVGIPVILVWLSDGVAGFVQRK